MEDSSEDEMEFSEEEEDSEEERKEMLAKCAPMHQNETSQLKKLSSEECSQAQHSTGETISFGTSESSQHSKWTRSDHGGKFDVFLSHSGKQKNFVRQLYRDLTNQGLSCFFDQDRDESLPVGEEFPPRIFEAVETCKVAIFLLSMDFLHSKWPMLELAACVKARGTSLSKMIMIPLFYIISPADLKQITSLDNKWKEFGIEEQQRVEWHNALKAIGRINGLKFIEDGNEVEFREEIVKEIWGKLPAASPRYHVPFMKGEVRMCQEVADFFNNVKRNEKGIRMAGLYGIAGQGKTMLGKVFCNFKLKDFEGKVCHLDFSRGNSFERAKVALHYLIHWPRPRVENLTQDQAQVELHKRMNGQTVLLVLDNITEEIKIKHEVRDLIKADLGKDSCILLSARSLDILEKCYKIQQESCLRVPSLEEEDAIAILVGSKSPEESRMGTEDKAFALKCANRCSFQEPGGDNGWRGRRFHPLALQAFGSYLSDKYGSNLSNWVAEIDGLVDRSLNGLHDVFNLLDEAFNAMTPEHRTIFMLLSLYIPPNMSVHNVTEWLAISCNKDIKFVEGAVEKLCRMAFIEEFKPEIRIHDLYIEFAQSKAKEMGRWLCCKADETQGLISQYNAGFELAKLEGCRHRKPSEITRKSLENLLMLQLVDVQNVNKLDLGRMESLRSLTLDDCRVLSALDGMDNLLNLAWLQIRGLGKALKLPKLSSLTGLQYLEIDIAGSQFISQLGDLKPCSRLKVIDVSCPSLLEFPMLNRFPFLEKVKFSMCDKVQGALYCKECVELESIVLVSCCKMTAPPLVAGCKKVSEIVLSDCGAVMAFPAIDLPCALKTLELHISSNTRSAPKSLESCDRLENLRLLNMEQLVELPSFRSLSSLTVLEIGKCGIMEPPDLSCCIMLEDVHFYNLKNLERFANFSLLSKLKKLSLCNCSRVRDPPDISGCHQLRLFHLIYNDNMKGLSKTDYAQFEEVKVSWQCEDDEVSFEEIDPVDCKVDDDLETCLDCFKDVIVENLNDISVPVELEQWTQGKTMLVKKYFRGVKLYYSVTAPYESDISSRRYKSKDPITLKSVGSKLLAYSTLNSVIEDSGWLNSVRKYIASATAASGINVDTTLRPMYHFFTPKTTIVKAFCDLGWGYFNGKVWHANICGGAPARQKVALHSLSQFRNLHFELTTDYDRAHSFFNSSMDDERVLLVVDNISENSIDEVRCYDGVELEEMRCILWTARSVDALHNSKWFEEEEVVAIVIQRISGGTRSVCLRCTNRCSFKEDRGFVSRSHQLALKAFGRHSSDLSKWLPKIGNKDGDHLDQVFAVLDQAVVHEVIERSPGLRACFSYMEEWSAQIDCVDDVFAGLCWLAIMCLDPSLPEEDVKSVPKRFMKEIEYIKPKRFKKEIEYIKAKMSSDEVVKWLLRNCEREIKGKLDDINRTTRKEFGPTYRKGEKGDAWKIVEDISFLLRPSQRCHVPTMQGKTRMCQEVADLLKTVLPNEKGIRIAGLYGMPGIGKTTLVKAFCNHKMGNFAGKVCVVQFSDGNALDRQKHALRYLTEFPMWQLESVTSIDDAQYKFNTFVKGQSVLLVLDNITEDSIDEVRHYLRADLGKDSCILMIARSVDVLENFNIDLWSRRHVPRLEEEEAVGILLGKMYVEESALGTEHRVYALKCANICSFKEGTHFTSTFHPLALKAFGRHLFRKHGSDLSKWVDGFTNEAGDGLEGMFDVVEKAFDDMDPRYRRIFVFLARHLPQNKPSDIVVEWLALICNKEVTYIKEAVKDLCENAFIEEIEPEIRIHDFFKEFVQIKQYNYDEVEDEAKFRVKIVRDISGLLREKYHVPAMRGEARMCQDVADFFNTVHPNDKRIRIAGLYGMSGMGKTTIAKAFCNLNFENFDGNVYHLEFASRGHTPGSQNFKLLTKSLQGQRVLLVVDNIQTEESIDGVRDFLRADLGENSWILFIARRVDDLKNFIEIQSCMSLPGLEEKEAIAILLESTSLAESALEAESRDFALQCAKKCSFKKTSCVNKFVPLVLKTFGRHLVSKYGSDLSKWVPELDGLVIGSDDGLGNMLAVLDKCFEYMDTKYQTMFMLLTVYMPPNMPPNKVTEWLAINCKEKIDFIEKAVEDLWQKAFIEEIKPQILIHDLCMEFAQRKAKQMGRWLWCNRDVLTSEAEGGLFSQDKNGFELAKLEYWQHRDLYQIGDRYTENLWALQVACKEISKLGLSSMKNIRSLTLHYCENLEVIQGVEKLGYLAWLQIEKLPKLKVLNIGSLAALKYLEINTSGFTELGDLTGCVSLIDIYVRCPSLWEFPRINGLPNLEKASFKSCEEVIGPLDCRACVKLQSIAFEYCCQMAHLPLIDGCSNKLKIVLNRCDQVTECSDEDKSSALAILKLCISLEDASVPRHSECCDGLKDTPLWNIVVSTNVPSLRRFSNLTVLKLYNCGICEPPDVACCKMLEDVCFSTLKDLESFPNFSSLLKLKKLCLYNCQRVRLPPDIGGCYKLQVFHLLYNDNMRGVPKIYSFQPLEEIKLSWHSEEVFDYSSDSYENEDIEFCLDYQKDDIFSSIKDIFIPEELKEWQWIQSKRVRVKQYFRGQELYNSIIAPFESYNVSEAWKQTSAADSHQVIIQRASAISGTQYTHTMGNKKRRLNKSARHYSEDTEHKLREEARERYYHNKQGNSQEAQPYEVGEGSSQGQQAQQVQPSESQTNEDMLRFREKVTKAIGRLIPPRLRFPYSSMQKSTTLNWLEKASTIKGVHVANLYEVAGNEKTALCWSFYNFSLKGFVDETTVEFSAGNSMERLNSAFQYLTCSPGSETALNTGDILVEDAFFQGPTFNIMILLIRYTIPDRFMNNNLMDIATNFNRNWGGKTRMVFHSQMYTIIELSRA